MPFKPYLHRLLSFALLASAQAATATECQPPKLLSASDTEAILLLAKDVGMAGPLRLCSDWWGAPSGCEAVRVETLPTTEGNQRSWQRLYLGRAAKDPERQCPWGRESSRIYRQGAWVAAKDNLSAVTTWRFTHGQQHVEVRLGQGVSYEMVDTIIRALREHTWRDELNQEGRALVERAMRQGPEWVNRATSVYKSFRKDGAYEVGFGELGSLVLQVELEGTLVKLLRADIVLV